MKSNKYKEAVDKVFEQLNKMTPEQIQEKFEKFIEENGELTETEISQYADLERFIMNDVEYKK